MLKNKATWLLLVLFFLATTLLITFISIIIQSTAQTNLEALIMHPDVPVYNYQIISQYPHDTQAYTEGLLIDEGYLYESTGLYAQSTLRRSELATGKIVQEYKLAPHLFAEGMSIIGNDLYQLTYQSRIGFVYDKHTFKLKNTFHYSSEGWGLTTDSQSLIMSDGSATLTFFDPQTFKPIRSIVVQDQHQPIRFLNELEYIKGKIYANIWESDLIAIISPDTGNLTGWINLQGLDHTIKHAGGASGLNGIAYHAEDNTLLVTGKNWPYIYAIRLKSVHNVSSSSHHN